MHLGDRSAQTIVRAATLREKLRAKLPISPSHSTLTPGQPVLALTRVTPDMRAAPEVPDIKSLDSLV